MKKYTNKKKTAITIAFMGILGLCAVMGMSQKEYKSTYATVEPSTQAIIYDDNSYSITLSYNELNYVYENAYNYVADELGSNGISFKYSLNSIADFTDFDTLFEFYDTDDGFVYANVDNTENDTAYIYFYNSDYTFGFYASSHGNEYEFIENQSLTIDVEQNEYANFKQAIELDIQANQVSQGDSIISAITSGLGLAPDVANEFVKGFTAVFWDSTNNSLTRVSNFMLVMLGIAMVMAIIKLSLSLIRSNTGA